MVKYEEFLAGKTQNETDTGFEPLWIPEFLTKQGFEFQGVLTEWAIRKGKAALFEDCGLGKSPQQLVWAENVVRHTNKPVLIATPLAVSYQLLREAEKFGVEAVRSSDGKVKSGARIVVTNYERLEHFDSADFSGMVCDESSILKNFNGVRKAAITEFMRTLPYRLLCTATAAPNDFTELGTSSEALGHLGYMDMLARFFKNTANTSNPRIGWRQHKNAGDHMQKWRFRGHAEIPFWKWVCSWSRAVRMPSDLGFDNGVFELPKLTINEHIIEVDRPPGGMLFSVPAVGLAEQRTEKRRTIQERCERVADLVAGSDFALVWCNLNDEGDLLTDLIDGAHQVKGADSDDKKETTLRAFADGELRVLVTKPKIGAWGLNLQHCAHVVEFPTHSYESHYQGIRRCWRFGQERPVVLDIVASDGETEVLSNLRRKAASADRMFSELVRHMYEGEAIHAADNFTLKASVPAWL